MSDARNPVDDDAAAEEVDLDAETRRRIIALHTELEERDHYELLGVSREADKKAVKKAYYDLAATFHPDRYFRKRLGSYKTRMEAIFARVTLAHDVLSDAAKRAEYDGYLAEQRRSRSMEDLMADALAEVRRAQEAIAHEAQEPPQPFPLAPSATLRAAGSVPPNPPAATATGPASRSPPTAPALTDAARRDSLARRLLAGRPPPAKSVPPARSATPSRPPTPMPSAAEAVGALRRRYEERAALAKQTMVKRYVDAGNAALASKDVVAAASSFRIASNLAPDDADLAAKAREAQVKADGVLGDVYSRQAVYEEKNEQWTEAARSWARVCRARPDDANAHERAANALLKSSGDKHEAGRLAQRACLLAPDNARFRVTLALVYQAAGLGLNARRELETAAQLAPHDDTIREMIRRAGKTAER